jgi:hypothetical protein
MAALSGWAAQAPLANRPVNARMVRPRLSPEIHCLPPLAPITAAGLTNHSDHCGQAMIRETSAVVFRQNLGEMIN